MPDGTKLKKAKLRGVESHGMILAEDELGIGTDHDGIMVLDDELAPGTPLADVLPIATDVLELEITPNRPDCLGVYGVAREVHAATGAPLAPPPWRDDPGTPRRRSPASRSRSRTRTCARASPRALFEDVTIGPSPPWLKARLMAAGMRPINNVVDITNYVMLADRPAAARVRLRPRRRRPARRAARARGRDDDHARRRRARRSTARCCVIDDADGPTSLAGIMGGERSEVRETTTRVLMEAATWNGPNIQRTSTRLGLRRGVAAASRRACSPSRRWRPRRWPRC